MAVARSSSGRVTKSQREGAVLGFSSPLAIHCNAFAANSFTQQQKETIPSLLGVMGVHSVSEVAEGSALTLPLDRLLLLLLLLRFYGHYTGQPALAGIPCKELEDFVGAKSYCPHAVVLLIAANALGLERRR